MKRYRTKPETVEAVQLSRSPGVHGDQIKEWREIEAEFGSRAKPIGNQVNGAFECVAIAIGAPWHTRREIAQPGDWIVRKPDGTLMVVREDDFADRYEDADDGTA